MYGHVEKLAEEIRKGAASVEGVEAKLWQVRFDFLHKWLYMLQCETMLKDDIKVLLTLTNNIRF